MRKIGKRIITLILCVIMAFSGSLAAYAESSDEFVIDENGVLTAYNGPKGVAVKIPDNVKEIGTRVFYKKGIESVIFPEGLKKIGDYAFTSCVLKEIEFPESLEEIGEAAFWGIQASNIVIPEKVTKIGARAFAYCVNNLTDITIPGSLETISEGAFSNCTKLENVTMKEGVKNIEKEAFGSCYKLTDLSFLADSIESIGEYAFRDCTGLKEITLPKGLRSLGNQVFVGCNKLTDVTFSEGITTLDKTSFWRCTSLNRVTLPDSLKTIGESVFRECTGLTTINIPEGVTSIGREAFYDCGLTELTLPGTVENVGKFAFQKCKNLASLTLKEGIKVLENQAFSDCESLTELIVPASLTSYENAFTTSGLKTVEIKDGAEKISYGAFSYCKNLDSVKIPGSVTEIEGFVFAGCTSLAGIELPSKLEKIGMSAFKESGLKTIVIPDSVTEIMREAFYGCKSLESVKLPDNEKFTKITIAAFQDCTNLKQITVPDTVTVIEEFAFFMCESLPGINLPEGITEINPYSFGGCISFTKITLPKNCYAIWQFAFSGCNSLKEIVWPECEFNIGNYGFAGGAFEKLVFPENLVDMAHAAFGDCKSLTSATFLNPVTTATYANELTGMPEAFKNSDNVTFYVYEGSYSHQYAIDHNVPYVLMNPFVVDEDGVLTRYYGPGGEVVIPDNVKKIGEKAFVNSSVLIKSRIKTLIISDGVTDIGNLLEEENYIFDVQGEGKCNVYVPESVVDFAESKSVTSKIMYHSYKGSALERYFNKLFENSILQISDYFEEITSITFDATDNTEISADKLAELKKDNKTQDVVIETENADYTFRYGKLPATYSAVSYDFTAEMEKDYEKAQAPDSVGKDEFVAKVSFSLSDELLEKSMVSVFVGKEYAGKYVDIIPLNKEKGSLQTTSVRVDENGKTGLFVPGKTAYIISVNADLSTLPGDVDENGEVTAEDALMVLKHVAHMITLSDTASADVDGNIGVTAEDALMILKYVAHMIESFK